MSNIIKENPIVYRLTKQREKIVAKYEESDLWVMFNNPETKQRAADMLIAYHFPLILFQIKKLKNNKIDHGEVFANALYHMRLAFDSFKLGRGKFSSFFLTYYFYNKVISETLNTNLISLNPTNYQLQNRIKRCLAQGMSKEEIITKYKLSAGRYEAVLHCPKCNLIDQYNCERGD